MKQIALICVAVLAWQVSSGSVLTGVNTSVTITSPTSSATYDAGTATTVALSGSAISDRTVTACTWTNSLGGSGTTTGTTAWSITSLALTVGTNVVTVTCLNAAGVSGVDVVTVTRSSSATSVFTGTTRSVACSGDITSTLQSTITASANDDIISIGAGSCSMGSRLNQWSNKKIWIKGAGKTSTVITANDGFSDIEYTGSTAPRFRLSDLTLQSVSDPGGPIIQVWADQSASWRGPFRIDHVTLDYPAGGAGIYLHGPIYGQIDNSRFSFSYESVILVGLGVNTETGSTITSLHGAFAASLPFDPGGATNLVIEDNVFDCNVNGSAGSSALDTERTGARVIFRYNTLDTSNLYAHWTSGGNWNQMWLEAYNNNFTGNYNSTGIPIVRLQGGGTGLFYNNTCKGNFDCEFRIGNDRAHNGVSGDAPTLACDGSHNWDGNAGDASAPGWPCLGDTGRNAGKTMAQIQAGSKQGSFPLYLWNNGGEDKCSDTTAAGAACSNSLTVDLFNMATYFTNTGHTVSGGGFGQGDVDWCINSSQPSGCGTHTLTYTPLAHPHPSPLQ